MRKYSLRQTANRYLKMDNRGNFKDKKHRAFVIHKMIDDLFVMGDVPASWQALKSDHVRQLIQLWQKRRIKSATIMRYMTIIRNYLKSIDCQLSNIDNKSLQLTRSYKRHKKNKIQPKIWQSITEPTARFIMALQTQFGLTFSEAIHLLPDIHIKEDVLLITREMAFNSEDRMIPVRNETQVGILKELRGFTDNRNSLAQLKKYDAIRIEWRTALSIHGLPCNKTWRYLYAQQMHQELSPTLGSYQTCWLIRDEMGIKSRNTLWLYLNE